MAYLGLGSTRAAKATNPYTSEVVEIAIGPEKVLFRIHKAKLERLTSFLTHHESPINAPSHQKTATPSEAGSDESIWRELERDDVDMNTSYVTLRTGSGTGAGDEQYPKADYELDDEFHTVNGFGIFTLWLYNEPPEKTSKQWQPIALLHAYYLARLYKAYQLQNHIVDCFRHYHNTMHIQINLDYFFWLADHADHFGGYEECPLIAYLVKQVAFEIAARGYDDIQISNSRMDRFLKEGQPTIRFELVKALAKHAYVAGEDIKNPAEYKLEKWYVKVLAI